MKLKEEIHRSIDTLDNYSLSVLYEQVQMLQRAQADTDKPSTAPSLEEVLDLTSCSPGEWSDDVIADREERI